MPLPKGSKFSLEKTRGLQPNNYDLYNLNGLTLGKVECIIEALKYYNTGLGSVLAGEIIQTLGEIDERQTIDGR